MKALSIALAAAVLATSSAHAGTPRSVDARTLEIAGVRTGMGYDEARAAAAKHFRVEPSQIKSEMVLALKDPVSQKKLPRWISYQRDGVKFIAHFEIRAPLDHRHPLVVRHVIYEIPSTQENASEMAKAAIAKYGEPTVLYAGTMQWCASLSRWGGCDSAKEAVLSLNVAQLELQDQTWLQAYAKYLQDAQARKPSF